MAALSVDGTPMPALPNSADQINYDNTTSGMSATTAQGAIDELASNKQPKVDNNLTTTSKETTGAINELKSGLTNLSSAFHEVAVNESFNIGPQIGFVAWLGWDGKRIRGYMPMPNDSIYRGTYQAEITTGENLTVSANGSVTNLDKTKISAITIYPSNGLVVIDFSEAPLNNVNNTIVSVITSFTVTRTA